MKLSKKIPVLGAGILTASQASALITHVTAELDVTYTGAGDGLTPGYIDPTGSGNISLSDPGDGYVFNAQVNGGVARFDFFSHLNAADDREWAEVTADSSIPVFFNYGDSINSNAEWTKVSTGNTDRLGSQSEGSPFYIGFRLDEGGLQHGWVRATLTDKTWNGSGDNSISLTIHEMAFTTEGEAITAGQTSLTPAVPEPAHTAALIGAGAIGLAAYRRRKKQSKAS